MIRKNGNSDKIGDFKNLCNDVMDKIRWKARFSQRFHNIWYLETVENTMPSAF